MFFEMGGNTKRERRVFKRFAIWPTHIGYAPDGKSLYCWLGWYLVKKRTIGALYTHSFRPVSDVLPGFASRTDELLFYP